MSSLKRIVVLSILITLVTFGIHAAGTAASSDEAAGRPVVADVAPSGVTVTPASGGGAISADTAADASGGGSYTTLGDAKVEENDQADISTGTAVTLILQPPAGWKFKAATGSATSNNKDISSASVSVLVTATSVTVTFDVAATGFKDTLTISGLQVRPDAGLLASTSPGNITRSGGTATFLGLTGSTNFGSLAMVAGAPATMTITQGDNQSGASGATLPTDPSVKLEDQFTNPVSGKNVSWTPGTDGGSTNAGTSATNGSGIASIDWTLGPGDATGAQTLVAAYLALSRTFNATATCDYSTRADGAWNAGATWVGGCVPDGTRAVKINPGHDVTVTANAAAASIEFVAGGASSSIAVTSSGATLAVGGLIDMKLPGNGNEALLNAGDGTVSAASVQMNGSGSKNTRLLIDDGTIDIVGDLVLLGSQNAQTIQITGSGRLEVGGDLGSDFHPILSATSTVRLDGTSPQSIDGANNPEAFANLEIANDVTTQKNLWVDGDLTIFGAGTLNMGAKSLKLAGDLEVDGDFNSSGTVNAEGATPQTFSGDATIEFENLSIGSSAGVTLQTSIEVGGTLSLGNEHLTTGANVVTILAGGTVSNGGGGFVIGNLAKVFTAASQKDFEVGTGDDYSPASVDVTAGTFPTTFMVKAVAGAHPSSPTDDALQRYWTLTPGAVTAADLEFDYVSADVVSDEAALRAAKYSSAWTYPAGTYNNGANNFSIAGVTSFSDFTMHAKAESLVITSVNGGSGVDVTAGTPFDVVVEAHDSEGNPVGVGIQADLTLTVQTGTGPISGTTTGTIAVGQSSTTITGVILTKAETGVVLRASDDGDLGVDPADSDPFDVVAGATHHFAVDAPASVTAGDTFTATVTAQDEWDNTTPDYEGTIAFSSSDGDAVLPADYTFTGADAGVHAFTTVQLFLAGTQDVTVEDGDLTGSDDVLVNPGPLDHFSVEKAGGGSIPTQTIHVPFSIAVYARDDYGNVATSFTGTVDISSTGTLTSGAGTTSAFTAGVLSPHGVTISNQGTFTITATLTGGGETGTSNSFQVLGYPDLSVKVDAPKYSSMGETETVFFKVRNHGPLAAQSTKLTIKLPTGWTFQGGAGCASNPCSLGTMDPGESVSLYLHVGVPADEQEGSSHKISASVASPTGETDDSDNEDSDTTKVVACTVVDDLAPTGTAGLSGKLTWEAPAAHFEVYFGPAGSGCSMFAGSTETLEYPYSGLEPGQTYEWKVKGYKNGCPVAESSCVTFTTSCDTLSISGLPETTTGSTYHVLWNEAAGATQYRIEESTTADFTGATSQDTAATQVAYNHVVAVPTAYYYRVRPVGYCNESWSPTLRVVVQPPGSPDAFEFDIVVEFGSDEPVQQQMLLDQDGGPAALDATFTATSNVPWLTVSPSAGTIPAAGMQLTVTIDPSGLPVGASTGIVTVKSGTGAVIATYTINLHAMTALTIGGKTASGGPRWIIPAVAHAAGINSVWKSDVRVFNPAATPATQQLFFTPSGNDGTKNSRSTTVTIEPGATLALGDVVRYAFGYGAMGENAFGAMEIRPAADEGTAAVITSRTYNDTEDGTYGQLVPAVPIDRFASYGERLSLQHLAQNGGWRTNVGVVEGLGAATSVTFRMYDDAGAQIGLFPAELAPFEHRQFDALLAQQGITAADARVEVEVVSSEGGAVTAYGSVIDNGTNDPMAVEGILSTDAGAQRFVTPGVAHFDTPTNHWRTDVRIHNAGLASVEATLLLYPQGSTTPLSKTVTVAAGETKGYDNIVGSLFASSNLNGALHVVTSTEATLGVTSRTYDSQAAGSYGQFIPAMTVSGAATMGGGARQILDVEQSARYRSNVGFAEVAGHDATVEISVSVADGRTGSMTITLAPYEYRQFGSLLTSLGLAESSNARISVTVTGGQGAVVAYSSMIDNGTQDPTYIPAQ